ncbi:helix-turn-helix domain-containing protein [Rheinheimera sp. WS51]|uniref:helix-turn-helix domain-containing protein n=1 Tax=Rheinheimera sp. WS51 TaxID=3425886 RepID=UPI003D8B9F90
MRDHKPSRSKSNLANSPKRVALGQWLRQQREAKGLTMRDLSAISGKPHSYFGKMEQAQRGLDVLEFIELCKWMEIVVSSAITQLQKL